ncbi:hypothetical protein ACOI9A_11180 [Corynebacterium amycolatum]|uniref:hypothetical protein n=1 Tax=Corynebacterium amycolatum TaxID=43765 RepID=UPI003B5B5AE1
MMESSKIPSASPASFADSSWIRATNCRTSAVLGTNSTTTGFSVASNHVGLVQLSKNSRVV